eukprot:3401080-Prymnesium_polylepis.1
MSCRISLEPARCGLKRTITSPARSRGLRISGQSGNRMSPRSPWTAVSRWPAIPVWRSASGPSTSYPLRVTS